MSLIRRCPPLVLSAALFITSVQAATVQTGRTEFSHSIKEVSAAATTAVAAPRVSRIALKDEESSASMNFEVALRMRNFDELQARIARGEQISRAEMASRYFPLAEDQESVVQWLKSQGLEVTRTDDNNLAVFVRGPVNSVAQALQVAFARVTAADGNHGPEPAHIRFRRGPGIPWPPAAHPPAPTLHPEDPAAQPADIERVHALAGGRRVQRGRP